MSSESQKGEESGTEKVFREVMAEKHQNLVKDMNLPIQESGWNSHKINTKKLTPRQIIGKVLETKRQRKKSWKQQERNNTLPIGKNRFR